MFQTFIHKVRLTLTDRVLQRRLLFLLGILVIFRALATIPIPGVDTSRLAAFFANNQFFGVLNLFSGGGLSKLSIVMLGVAPYITASIFMQLSTILSPKMKAMQSEEGEAGRMKLTQYSRYLTIPIAAVQGYSFIMLLISQGALAPMSQGAIAVNVLTIVAGSILLMWLGELISEFGIGNGVSVIIFAGIVASIPSTIAQMIFNYSPAQIPMYIAYVAIAAIVTAAVVYITEAERPVPITYAREARRSAVYSSGAATYLPLRVNQAGVIPIIFALSILTLPQMLAQVLSMFHVPYIVAPIQTFANLFNNTNIYAGVYFVLVVAFTYFYTAVTFDPDQIATNLQKSGGYVHGIRPGEATAEYIGHVITRITLFGALFLGVIAVLPLIMKLLTGQHTLAIGGTAMLIVVSVVLDLVKKIDAQISVREY